MHPFWKHQIFLKNWERKDLKDFIKNNLFFLFPPHHSQTNFHQNLKEDLFSIELLMFAEQSTGKSMCICNKTVGDGDQGVFYVFKHA